MIPDSLLSQLVAQSLYRSSHHIIPHINILIVWNVFIDFLRVLESPNVHVVVVDLTHSCLEVGLIDVV
jgi:hypothetical protein